MTTGDASFTAAKMLVLLASIYVIIASQCCSSLVLEFDGSWRPSPRDPIPGFQIADSSFSSTTASASAALFRSHVVDDDGNSAAEERPFASGAKSLSDTRTRTSADAEYEGLLMGLDQLATVLASCDDDVLGEHHELIIRGDCKAVIDQLNSRSNPRKTEIYYEQAIEKIQHIKEISSVTTFAFELVPRESNTLCDTLCKLVLNIEQKRVVASVQDLILSDEEEILSKEQNSVAINNVHMRKRSVKKKSFRLKSNHYEVAMEEIRNNSRICQSSRLALACLLSRSAIRTNDVAILLQLSDFFLQSSRKFTKIYWGDSPNIAVTKGTIRAISILCELFTMLSIGAEEEALKLRTKHKIIIREDRDLAEKLNEEFDSLLEFCTNNKKKQDQALFPYTDIVTSEFLDKGSYREELLEWNSLATGLKTLKAGIWLNFSL